MTKITLPYEKDEDPNICDGYECTNKAIDWIEVDGGTYGLISLKLCKDHIKTVSGEKSGNFEL
ncbi:MAG: hypothetical protein R2685_14280 [Candidatus Nitrosocosmicus sp.]|nr:hypothetical protein [Candidatus Nitrosocosmicus sp.]